ncbi:nucleotidyltransferase family protein [Dyadobacter sandarakinus]|uniref:Nucleotidyltransferase domain-containing protein n=1 Tax=Dyadobacter sandarakinus TaxID=2747268 RepID=A0ABX7IFT3_9BACT|nr:nucleotidyltransferase domain-containing protein [Dyadobacter sandarakinus]
MLLYDHPPKDFQALQEIFASVNVPIEVWAYGSRVNGSAHDGSDLDLVIRSEDLSKLDADVFFELKDKIRESNIPILVDLLDWARIAANFQRNIEERFEVIFQYPPKPH